MTSISNSGIVLVLTSIQSLVTSIAIVSHFKNITKNNIYKWSVVGIVLSILSIVIGVLSYFNIIVYGIYHVWVMLFVFFNLIIIVMAIYVLKSPNGWITLVWIVSIVACIVFISFEGNYLLPLSPSETYKEYTG